MTDEVRESGQAGIAPAASDEEKPAAIPTPPGATEWMESDDDASAPAGESEKEPEAKAEEPAKETEEKAEDDGDSAGDDAEDDKPQKKRPSGSERQKRKIAALEAELANLRSRQIDDGAALQSAVEREIGPPPREEDFKGDYLAYEREMQSYRTDYRITQRELRKEAQAATLRAQAAIQEAVEDHQERIDEFRKKVPDFDDAVSKSGLTASKAVELAVLESEHSAHLVYHLAKNPRLLAGLNGMNDRQVVREIGRIEASLKMPEAKTKTEAKKPIAPVKGSAPPSFDPYRVKSGEMDMERFIQWRNAGGK